MKGALVFCRLAGGYDAPLRQSAERSDFQGDCDKDHLRRQIDVGRLARLEG